LKFRFLIVGEIEQQISWQKEFGGIGPMRGLVDNLDYSNIDKGNML
jgi:hypothetical protein